MKVKTDTEWIDKILIKKAKKISKIIEEIDWSWKQYLEKMKQHDFCFPFPGQYEVLFDREHVLIKAWEGKLVIGKIISMDIGQIRILNQPLICEKFSIWGQFAADKTFVGFYAYPAFGVHYLSGSINNKYIPICIGEIKLPPITSYEILQKSAEEIVKNLEVINLDSLGRTYLPDKYKEFKIWLEKYKDSSTSQCIKMIKAISRSLLDNEEQKNRQEEQNG